MNDACAFTSICGEDAQWVTQYLREATRLQLPFVIHLDRCPDLAPKFKASPLCAGVTYQNHPNVEFNETHKQAPFDVVVRSKNFRWAVAWDIDETYEADAETYFAEAVKSDADWIDVPWKNLWGDERHIRVDGPFSEGHRVKFYNLQKNELGEREWLFVHKITNGPKCNRADERGMFLKHPVALHWGMMTPELREQHRLRWDRIYTVAVGANPYGFWNYACDRSVEIELETHTYLR